MARRPSKVQWALGLRGEVLVRSMVENITRKVVHNNNDGMTTTTTTTSTTTSSSNSTVNSFVSFSVHTQS